MSTNKRFKRNDPQLSFSKIHVPKMRSVFWKYFGFPSNENDEIITKQKVVCTLCNAVLTNHYNTTNIRAHMQSTHKQIFAELIETHGIQVPPRKVQKKIRTISKSELTGCDDTMNGDEHQSIKQEQISYCSSSALHEDDSINLLEAIPLTYDDTDRTSKDEEFSDGETSNHFLEQSSNHMISPLNRTHKHKTLAPLNITVDINPIQMPIEYDIEEALCKMIVKDLQNVSTVYDSGMEELLIGLLSNQVFPSMNKIESALKQLHSEKFYKLKDRIKIHSQVKLYSISFDVWTNIENKQFVSIYFNNISEEYENQFCDNLYMTVELNNYTMFDQIFDDFNLENCSAAVINCNHKILNTFLSNNDIPIIHCFSYILNTCIEDVFKIPEVWSVLDEVQDVITRYAPEICSEDVEIPTICQDFPMTKINVLKFFCENVSWPEELDYLISKAKHILDAISPLEVTLDTFKEEDIPLSSLFLPFADKIIKKHFKINEDDDVLLQEIKSTIVKEFKSSICSNNHLTLTALLDPRFHKFLWIKNFNTCVSILDKKYAQISKQRGYLQKCEPVKNDDAQRSSKKSHLKLFFDCPDAPAANLKSEILIESDLRRYREEACASLEESPLQWWNQWGNMYGSLKYLADAYNCILGFVNMSLKNNLKDQMKFHKKRFMLTGKLIDQILYLNKNL